MSGVGKINVVVVEPDEGLRLAIERACKRVPAIRVVRSCATLPELNGDSGTDVSALIIGCHAFGANPEDTTRSLRSRFPRARLIGLAAVAERHRCSDGLATKLHGFICRDDPTLSNLTVELDEVLVKRSFLSARAKQLLQDAEKTDWERFMRMTAREREIAGLVALGLDDAQIAEKAGISRHTVDKHVRTILLNYDAHTRRELVARLPVFLRSGNTAGAGGGGTDFRT